MNRCSRAMNRGGRRGGRNGKGKAEFVQPATFAGQYAARHSRWSICRSAREASATPYQHHDVAFGRPIDPFPRLRPAAGARSRSDVDVMFGPEDEPRTILLRRPADDGGRALECCPRSFLRPRLDPEARNRLSLIRRLGAESSYGVEDRPSPPTARLFQPPSRRMFSARSTTGGSVRTAARIRRPASSR